MEQYSERTVDLHCHILPHMDDGSRDTQMSRQMLEMLAQQGVGTVCLTSHYYAWDESVASFAKRRGAALAHLIKVVSPKQVLIPGAEVAFFPEISRSKELDTLCLQGTRTLLLEMPFQEWTQHQVEEVISLRLDKGYDVVLVHPERFLFSKGNEKYLERLMDLQLPLQVNAATICHLSTRREGLRLLDMTPSPLLGTDSHNLTSRKPCMADARKILARKRGKDFLELIDDTAAELLGRD